jgi:hypothetical protein
MDPVSAERCCTDRWHRAMRFDGDDDDLDDMGHVYHYEFVHGWVEHPESVMEWEVKISDRFLK